MGTYRPCSRSPDGLPAPDALRLTSSPNDASEANTRGTGVLPQSVFGDDEGGRPRSEPAPARFGAGLRHRWPLGRGTRVRAGKIGSGARRRRGRHAATLERRARQRRTRPRAPGRTRSGQLPAVPCRSGSEPAHRRQRRSVARRRGGQAFGGSASAAHCRHPAAEAGCGDAELLPCRGPRPRRGRISRQAGTRRPAGGGSRCVSGNAEVKSPVRRHSFARRNMLKSAAALIAARALPAVATPEMPDIPLLAQLLAGRTPRWGRLRLDLPALADNGLAVPLKLAMPGPFAPGPTVRAIHLFSEKNPVPDMAVFEFLAPLERIEIDTRVRLAGSQKVIAVALMSDETLYAAAAEVIVTIAACLDGS